MRQKLEDSLVPAGFCDEIEQEKDLVTHLVHGFALQIANGQVMDHFSDGGDQGCNHGFQGPVEEVGLVVVRTNLDGIQNTMKSVRTRGKVVVVVVVHNRRKCAKESRVSSYISYQTESCPPTSSGVETRGTHQGVRCHDVDLFKDHTLMEEVRDGLRRYVQVPILVLDAVEDGGYVVGLCFVVGHVAGVIAG